MPSVFICFYLAIVFLLGAAIGSFLNVCAARLSFEKSILWPGSHCFKCFQPVRWYDNLPLLSYWILRGRCRRCQAPFSIRYFLVELFTGLVFAGLFYADVVWGGVHFGETQRQGVTIHQGYIPLLRDQHHAIAAGHVPWQAWVVFGWHATLFSFLITAALCDLEHLEIPLSLTTTGTVVGLIGATILAWPFPATQPTTQRFHLGELPDPNFGLYPWPVWYPLPDWLIPNNVLFGFLPCSLLLGLLTGLAGALAGMVLLRAVRFLFGLGRGIEAMGLGDADLMMMAGAFVGWQPIVTAFLLAIVPGLFFGIGQALLRGKQEMPFGPSLAVGVMLTVLIWPWVGDRFYMLFFAPGAVIMIGAISLGSLLLAAYLLRVLRGPAVPEGEGNRRYPDGEAREHWKGRERPPEEAGRVAEAENRLQKDKP
jgi:leader peptidase (prepilin peptidase)/N-methyltransferase